MSKAIVAHFTAAYPDICALVGRYWSRVANPSHREEMVAETVGYLWCRWVGMAKRGKDPRPFLSTFVYSCCRSVRSGRRVARATAVRDVYSNPTLTIRPDRLQSLPCACSVDDSPSARAWIDRYAHDPGDIVQAEGDWRLFSTGARLKQIDCAKLALSGATNKDIGKCLGIGESRACQLRRQVVDAYKAWQREACERADEPARSPGRG